MCCYCAVNNGFFMSHNYLDLRLSDLNLYVCLPVVLKHHAKYVILKNKLNYRTIISYLKEAKEKYRGIFKIQKSGDKTSSGEIGLEIKTDASPKVGQDQVSGEVSLLVCRTRCICSM